MKISEELLDVEEGCCEKHLMEMMVVVGGGNYGGACESKWSLYPMTSV